MQSLPDKVTVLSPTLPGVASNFQVIDALHSIKSTPYENSFLSRLTGVQHDETPAVFAVDWQTISPWMDLMSDVRDHYRISQLVQTCSRIKGVGFTFFIHSPERGETRETGAPIMYAPLRQCYLNQVHDLLHRVFWSGIDGKLNHGLTGIS
jgi:hypothetical protein